MNVQQKEQVNDSTILQNLSNYFINSNTNIFIISELGTYFNVNKRTIKDFINVCVAFNVCRKINNDAFEWYGYSNILETIEKFEKEIKTCSFYHGIFDLFNCSLNGSLENISISVVKLFIYLNKKYLDVHNIAKLFAQGQCKYNTMLRKLYTVGICLRICGVISKTNKVSEFKYNYHRIHIRPTEGMRRIQYILNTEEEIKEYMEFNRRMKIFDNYVNNMDPYIHNYSNTFGNQYFVNIPTIVIN